MEQYLSKGKDGLDAAGRPLDKAYLELGLPDWLQHSISVMQDTWDRMAAGETCSRWDCWYADLQSDINIAETENIISPEQAWYLREKYLHMERD